MSRRGTLVARKNPKTENMDDLRPVKTKHKLLTWIYRRPSFSLPIFKALKYFAMIGRMPLVWPLHPLLRRSNNYLINLPINENIKTESEFLPPAIVRQLILRAGYIHMLDTCPCRVAYQCKKHSHDIGCIVLGATGLDIVPPMTRPISKEEALAHVDRALEDGLVPTIARGRGDNYLFLTPDHHSLIALCFCCNCCCAVQAYQYVQPERVRPIYPWIEGLEIEVNDKCTGCGKCMDICYMNAIHIKNKKACHTDICRGCGRCASTCPNGAVDIRMKDPAFLEKTVNKFLSIAKID